jgi:Zn-finger nucleic acid-binding protein
MKCPIDNTDLVMSDRQGIEIDYCPQCRGVWLDRGEIDKIVERSVGMGMGAAQPHPQQPAPQAAPQYQHPQQHSGYPQDTRRRDYDDDDDDYKHRDGHHGEHRGHHKKENFLSDLFG